MALKRLTKKGYGQVELNNVAFRRDGRIEAQCKLGNSFSEEAPAENGMLLQVKNKTRAIARPNGNNDTKLIALHYSAEHMYDERANGLKDFKLVPGTFFPRLGYLAVGDKFTTNTVCYDDTVWTDDAAVLAAVKNSTINGIPSADGYIKLTKAEAEIGAEAAILLEAVEATTMPDGQPAVKFQVVRA